MTSVNNIMALPKGMKPPEPINKLICFDFDDAKWSEKIDELPTWIQDRVRKGVTY